MKNMLAAITETTSFIQNKIKLQPRVAIILGTGLGALGSKINIELSIPYSQIPNFPTATVEFHKGNLLLGTIGDTPVVAMQGRFHYYEGYSMQQVTFPVRVMKALGVQFLLLSNAAGGMNMNFKKGDLVLLDDHINELPENPLRGLNDEAFGNRFVDMSQPYNQQLNHLLLAKANELGLSLKQGIYVAVQGPNLETRAEYRHLKNIGADMVGMSTVPEVIVANHIDLPCAAISVITDECDPDHLQPISIAEIIEVAGKADEKLSNLFCEAIKNL